MGPFSIPSVKLTNSLVSHANDLNPASVQWLRRSVEINKLPQAERKKNKSNQSNLWTYRDKWKYREYLKYLENMGICDVCMCIYIYIQ